MNKAVSGILVVLSVLFFGGCTTLPEKIAPLEIGDAPYTKWSCEQLAAEQPGLEASLNTASDAQRRCRKADITGLLFIGLPVATLTGFGRSSEIARLKGELRAIGHAALTKGCPGVPMRKEDPSLQVESLAAGGRAASAGNSKEEQL